MSIRSPFKYAGGKFDLTTHLLRYVPPHDHYVEVFGGGANLLFAKDAVSFEVYNDLDQGLVNFFEVLKVEETFLRFLEQVDLTIYSRAVYDLYRETWSLETDPVLRAVKWYVVMEWSFGGIFGKGIRWQPSCRRRLAEIPFNWRNRIEVLDRIHDRVKYVMVDNRSFEFVLEYYDNPGVFFYLDPPYVHETRVELRLYGREMELEQHERLVQLLLKGKGMFLLSGYDHPVYEPLMEAGWRKEGIPVLSKIHQGIKTTRQEVLWSSPSLTAELGTPIQGSLFS